MAETTSRVRAWQMWQYCWLKNFKVERKKLTSEPVYTAEFAFPDPSFEAVEAKKS